MNTELTTEISKLAKAQIETTPGNDVTISLEDIVNNQFSRNKKDILDTVVNSFTQKKNPYQKQTVLMIHQVILMDYLRKI